MSLSRRIDVMISSTSRDLEEHRKNAREAVLQLKMFPLMIEDQVATIKNALDVSFDWVDQAEIYIGIFAHRYGYIPQDSDRNPHNLSITELEYRRAVERGIPILIFVIDDKHPVPTDLKEARAFFEQSQEGIEKLKRLKDELLTNHVVSFFSSPEDLLSITIQALGGLQKSILSQNEETTFAEPSSKEAEQTYNPETIPPQPRSHIYIAYSRDAVRSERLGVLLGALRQHQYEYWIDRESDEQFDDWKASFLPIIQSAWRLIVVVTPNSMQSDNVNWEATQARDAGIPIIPVIILPTPQLTGVTAGYSPIDVMRPSGQFDFDPLWEGLSNPPNRVERPFQHGANNDQIAEVDQLEFIHYVSALTDLIISPYTAPPITIGIFGTWGSGKSFLLDHIKRKIAGEAPYEQDPPEIEGDSRWQRLRRFLYAGRNVKSKSYKKRWRPFIKLGIIFLKLGSNIVEWLTDRRNKFREATKNTKNKFFKHFYDDELEDEAPKEVQVEIVEFNAWEYSATEVVWPGLVRKIMNLLEDEVSIPTRLWIRLMRNIKQQLSRMQLWMLLGTGAISAVFLLNVWADNAIWQGLTIVSLIGLVTTIYKIITDVLAQPLAAWVTNLFEKTDYGKQIGYMEDIRHDLELLERGLSKRNKRVLIIVDDLDRCEPEKAVEMLQAIKLLLDFDSFIVILGIDARIVTRAVEQHYKELLGKAGASGYEYLDKIIQIPFRIPEPTQSEIQGFIEQQMEIKDEDESSSSRILIDELNQTGLVFPEHGEIPIDIEIGDSSIGVSLPNSRQNFPEPILEPTPTVPATILASPFTSEEREVFKELSILLKPNPRHIKRLINVYRLIKALAQHKKEAFIQDNRRKTIHWIVLCGQWPYTVHAMLQIYAELLEDEFEEQQNGGNTEILKPMQNVLVYLHEIVNDQLNKDIRSRLDYDPDLFEWLMSQCQLTWRDLEILKMYTLNFNPAVQEESKKIYVVPPVDP